jgi:alginate O-acetyltransferase complex protein AlgI
MLFNSFVFLFAFLPIVYTGFWSLRLTSHRYAWLTVSSYVFYGWFNPWYCLLLAFSTLLSFVAGLGMLRFGSDGARRWCMLAPIAVDLLLLIFFKYAAFLAATLATLSAFAGFGWHVPQGVSVPFGGNRYVAFRDILLPVGISFYTFHTISYVIDCYRRTVTPTRQLLEFSAYVSLFSQLVAGPIVRFRQIEGDLGNLGRAQRLRWLPVGIAYFVYGLAEKVLVADTLAIFVNPAFDHIEQLSTLGAWCADLGYAFQLYFDFSGYSSMAIGLGYAFGLRIPINFNSPYKALDPSDFWRRWHISLSACLRDYVYIPLGGNRDGQYRAYGNLMLTMLIGGLWHGANWTFVVWGAYHGVLLALYRVFRRHWDMLPAATRRVGTFVIVLLGWTLFRSASLGAAGQMLRTMFVPTAGVGVSQPLLFAVMLGTAAFWAMHGRNVHELTRDFRWTGWATLRFSAIAGAALALMAGDRNAPFLYFQF